MPEIIEDGTGTGNHARVDVNHRLHTFSVSETEDKTQNRIGKVWSIEVSVTPTGANDYFFYLKNTGTADLAISALRARSSVITTIELDYVTGTPSYSALTALTATNRLVGNSLTPLAVISQDTDITGLTDSGLLYPVRCYVANKEETLETISNIIIPQGSAVALKRTAATGHVDMLISLLELGIFK